MFVTIIALRPKWLCPGGQLIYIGLYRANVKKSSCLKPEGLELDIWYVASPTSCRPLPSLLKFYPLYISSGRHILINQWHNSYTF